MTPIGEVESSSGPVIVNMGDSYIRLEAWDTCRLTPAMARALGGLLIEAAKRVEQAIAFDKERSR